MDGTQTLSRESKDIDSLITKHKGRHGELLSILEQTQLLNEHKYLSEEALRQVARRTGVPLSRIYNVVTFYSFFNLKPQGKHTLTVCRGTACHTKGSKALLDDVGLILNCSKALGEGLLQHPRQSVHHIHGCMLRAVRARARRRDRRRHLQQHDDHEGAETPQ